MLYCDVSHMFNVLYVYLCGSMRIDAIVSTLSKRVLSKDRLAKSVPTCMPSFKCN